MWGEVSGRGPTCPLCAAASRPRLWRQRRPQPCPRGPPPVPRQCRAGAGRRVLDPPLPLPLPRPADGFADRVYSFDMAVASDGSPVVAFVSGPAWSDMYDYGVASTRVMRCAGGGPACQWQASRGAGPGPGASRALQLRAHVLAPAVMRLCGPAVPAPALLPGRDSPACAAPPPSRTWAPRRAAWACGVCPWRWMLRTPPGWPPMSW